MTPKNIFITGISTDIGKTIAAAIITEALQADYWKPIQAGNLEACDTKTIAKLVSNPQSKTHPNSYALKTPMSPHAAAAIEHIDIRLKNIKRPETSNTLVIEGAGGLLVPLNNEDTILDLIQPDDVVIVVSRHYLGSINHTLLTLQALKTKNLNCYLIFSGNAHPTTEHIIAHKTQVPVIGRIKEEPYFDKTVVREYAELFKEQLKTLSITPSIKK